MRKRIFNMATNILGMGKDVTSFSPTHWKYISLASLTLQNAAAMLSIRYSRSRTGDIAIGSTLVLSTEVYKLLLSLWFAYKEGLDLKSFRKSVQTQVIGNPLDTLKVSVPAFVFLIQNNLIYLAGSHLGAAIYHVAYQLKIFTTAIFSVILLKRKLSLIQWLSLTLLVLGIVIVQLAQPEHRKAVIPGRRESALLGMAAIIGAAVCSGFAGVYFEKILKGSEVTMWTRNIQLALTSVVIGLCSCLFGVEAGAIREKGYFFGYDAFVLYLIVLQGSGGLMVGMVVKYADNLLKGFAFCISIIVSCAFSMVFFNFELTTQFSSGALLVFLAIYLYSCPARFPLHGFKVKLRLGSRILNKSN